MSDKQYTKFNLNEYVKVKLNSYGIQLLRNQHNELKQRIPFLGEFRPPTVDENGFAEYQLHDFMGCLGQYVGIGKRLPFETEILFESALQSQLDEAREEITASRNFIEDILGHATKSQLRAIQPFHVKYRNALNGGKRK